MVFWAYPYKGYLLTSRMAKNNVILDSDWKLLVPTKRRRVLHYEVSISQSGISLGKELVREAFSVKQADSRVWVRIFFNGKENALKFCKASEEDLNAYVFRQANYGMRNSKKRAGRAFSLNLKNPLTSGVFPAKITKDKEIIVTGVGLTKEVLSDGIVSHSEK